MKKIILILVLFLIGYISANARLISGQVICSDNGEPAIGASVLIKGTTVGTITDINGYYQIIVDSIHTTLRHSYIGYIAKEIKIENDSVINVSLKKEDIILEEFKITAYVEHIKSPFEITVYKSKIHKFFNLKGRKRIHHTFSVVGRSHNKPLLIEKDWISASSINSDTFLKHIHDNINYPDSTIYHGIEGRISVRFMIDLEGNIKDVEIIRPLDKWTTQEVLSAFQSAPQLSEYENRWRFGRPKNHIKTYILPIMFRMKR